MLKICHVFPTLHTQFIPISVTCGLSGTLKFTVTTTMIFGEDPLMALPSEHLVGLTKAASQQPHLPAHPSPTGTSHTTQPKPKGSEQIIHAGTSKCCKTDAF